jgi:putative spermidine/putrescine transport system permease protein
VTEPTSIPPPTAARRLQRRLREGTGPWRRGLFPYGVLLPSALAVSLFVAAMTLLLLKSFHEFVGVQITKPYTLATWRHFLTSGFYWSVVRTTVEIGVIVTVITLLLGYPTAYVLVQIRSRFLTVAAYVILFSPLLVSVVVRSYGWMLLLGQHGFLNQILRHVPGLHAPYQLVYNQTGVTIALVHILLPFAVFPILSVLRQLPPGVSEAAADLGATPSRIWRKVILPLSLPGIVSAAQIVFTLTISAWVTAALLGGGRVQLLGNLIYSNISELNWPLGAVESFVLLAIALLALGLLGRVGRAVHIRES